MFYTLPKDIIRLILLEYVHYPDIPNVLLVGKLFQVLRVYEKEKLLQKYTSRMWFYRKVCDKYPVKYRKRVNPYNVFKQFCQCPKCAEFLNIKNRDNHIKNCDLFHRMNDISQCKCGILVYNTEDHIATCKFLSSMIKVGDVIMLQKIK